MSVTIEFYSAHEQELVNLFSLEVDEESKEDTFFEELEKYPIADFSFHLAIPEDLDNLCKIMNNYYTSIAPLFRDILAKHLWSDDAENPLESLALINDSFTYAVSFLSDNDIEKIAQDWASTFSGSYDVIFVNISQSLLNLRRIAQDTLKSKKSLILRLFGDINF